MFAAIKKYMRRISGDAAFAEMMLRGNWLIENAGRNTHLVKYKIFMLKLMANKGRRELCFVWTLNEWMNAS